MTPYFFLILLMTVFQFGKFNKYVKASFIILFVFAGSRGNGSGDYFAYLKYAEAIQSVQDVFDSSFPMEIGFRIIAFLGDLFLLTPQFTIAAMNLISLLCIYIFISRYSKDKMLSVFLFLPFYFQLDMHAARTAVAVGIGTLAFKYIKGKNIFKFILIVFFASLFHKTALVLLILYPLSYLKISDYMRIISVVIIGILSFILSFEKVLLSLVQLLPDGKLVVKLSNYLNSEQFGYDYNLLDPRFILLVLIFVSSVYFLKNDEDSFFKNILWWNVLLILFLKENMFLMTRLNFYFNIYTILIVPQILSNVKVKIRGWSLSYNFLKMMVIGIYLIYILGIVLSGVVYKFFWIS